MSRRLPDKERDRLRKAAAKIDLQSGGAIIRTAAQGGKKDDFEREIKYLHKLHEVLCKRADETAAPAMVFQEADLPVRVARDIFSEQFERAIVDDPKQHHRLESFFTRTAPELLPRLELYKGEQPLFERYRAEEAIQSTLSRRVDLPSGGYLIIEYTEAMTVIDVNSGSFIGRGKGARLEDTIVKTNLEAADEAVRQLRLRDIGGIIVIDFIDMSRSRNRDSVLKVLRKALDEDRTKTYVVEISPLGLVEMTRQNVTEGVREILTKTCPTCEGEGVVLSEETVAIDAERQLRELAAERPDAEAYLVAVHPEVSTELVSGPRPRSSRSRRTPASGSTSRAPRRCRSTTSPCCWRAAAPRSRSARCRSVRARRSSSGSRSPTCTTRTTRWPSWTATSSRSRAPGASSARRPWSGSRRSAARPPRPSWWTRRPRPRGPARTPAGGAAGAAAGVGADGPSRPPMPASGR